ncbi:MAG: hypothetical protein ACKVU4_08480 [Phycisphaerales bacterium]
MNRSLPVCLGVAAASALAVVVPAFARQAADPSTPATPSASVTQPADALAGPRVRPRGDELPTLVESDYEGKVKRLDTTPEEGAIKLLTLTPEEQSGVDGVLADRAKLLEAFVFDNLDLLTRLGSASDGGERVAQLGLIVEAVRKTAAIREKGPLAEQLRGVLDGANREKFDALVGGYWDAVVKERQESGRRAGKREGRLGVLGDERLKAFGKEIERAFYRVADPGGEREFDELLAAMELRPEQESRVRRMAEDFIVGARFKPTPAQERNFILKVTSMLDQKQRRLLARHIAERERGSGTMGR